MLVEPLTAENINEICELDAACFAAPWQVNSWLSELRQSKVLGIKGFGGLLALASFLPVFDEAELTKIMVLPTARRRGLGEKVLFSALAALLDLQVKRLFLEVAEQNKAARAFYEKHGFIISGRRENYYENPSDNAILMELNVLASSLLTPGTGCAISHEAHGEER